MIEAMYNALEDREFAPSTVHRVHRTLRAALNRAVRRGILHESPMKRVDPPNGKIERRGVLNVDQSIALLDWLKIHHPTSYVGSYLALFTGMRRGEICGLQWKNVDFDRGTIRVVQSRQRRYKEDIVGAPKTTGSTRSIPMGVEVLEMLLDWKHQHQKHTQDRGETWDETAYVVRRLDGVLIDPMGLTHDVRLAVIALELPPVSFHDLRHTHATILLQANVPIKIVSERLGHASITMTADTYSHVTETMQKDATEKLSTIFRREDS